MMCLKRGPFTSDHEFVKTGHHILIIWAQEWAFLQGVCSLFSAFIQPIWYKTRIPELRPEIILRAQQASSFLHTCRVTLVRSCFNYSRLPFQQISTCKFYSGMISWHIVRNTHFSLFSVISLYSPCCVLKDFPQHWQHLLLLRVSSQPSVIKSQPPAFTTGYYRNKRCVLPYPSLPHHSRQGWGLASVCLLSSPHVAAHFQNQPVAVLTFVIWIISPSLY